MVKKDMGLLGRLTGKEKVRFPSSKDVDKAEDARRRAEIRKAEKEAYQRAYNQARIVRASREGSQAGSRRWYDSFQSIGSGVSTSRRSSGKGRGYKAWEPSVDFWSSNNLSGKSKKKGKKKGFGGFDMADNWGLMR